MLIWLGLSSSYAGEPIELEIVGLQAEGAVLCALYDDEKTWLKTTGFVAATRAVPADGRARCRFDDIEAGTYAISFLQDLNGNEAMDTNWMGLPKEPWGVSRDAPIRFGPPKFAAAAFQHPGDPLPAAHAR